MEVPIRELKNHLSEYLRRVCAGEDIHITLRGRRVARLVAEGSDAGPEGDPLEQAIERLRAMPGVRPGGGGQVTGLARAPILSEDEATLSDIVTAQRDGAVE